VSRRREVERRRGGRGGQRRRGERWSGRGPVGGRRRRPRRGRERRRRLGIDAPLRRAWASEGVRLSGIGRSWSFLIGEKH